MSLTQILLEDFTKEKFDRLAKFFKDNYFYLVYQRSNQLGYSDYYLDQGKYGMVLHSRKEYPNSIVRISQHTGEEYKKAVGKDFDNVVNVKFHRNVGSVYVTVMEKLQALPDDIDWDISAVKEHARELSNTRRSHEIYWAVNEDPKLLDKAMEQTKYMRSDVDDMRKFFNDVINGLKELKSIGIQHTDMHSGNIMYDEKTDNYKIIDLD